MKLNFDRTDRTETPPPVTAPQRGYDHAACPIYIQYMTLTLSIRILDLTSSVGPYDACAKTAAGRVIKLVVTLGFAIACGSFSHLPLSSS